MHTTYHLLHLVSVSFAVGLAYIALDRFRYSKRVINLVQHTLDHINDPARLSDRVRDVIASKHGDNLRKEIESIENVGLGIDAVLFKCPSIFGHGRTNGKDFLIMKSLLMLETVMIVYCTIFPAVETSYVYWTIVSTNIIGIVIPVFLLYTGAKIMERKEQYISSILSEIADMQGVRFTIDDINRRIDRG